MEVICSRIGMKPYLPRTRSLEQRFLFPRSGVGLWTKGEDRLKEAMEMEITDTHSDLIYFVWMGRQCMVRYLNTWRLCQSQFYLEYIRSTCNFPDPLRSPYFDSIFQTSSTLPVLVRTRRHLRRNVVWVNSMWT